MILEVKRGRWQTVKALMQAALITSLQKFLQYTVEVEAGAPAGFSSGVGNEGVRKTEVAQRGPQAEPRYGSGGEAHRS